MEERQLELEQLGFGNIVLLVAGEDQASLPGIGLKSIFGTLQTNPHIVQLAGQPFAGVLSGLPAGFEILIDEFVVSVLAKSVAIWGLMESTVISTIRVWPKARTL